METAVIILAPRHSPSPSPTSIEVLEVFAEHMLERQFSIEEVATLGGVPVETLYGAFAASGVEPQPPVYGPLAGVIAVVYHELAKEFLNRSKSDETT